MCNYFLGFKKYICSLSLLYQDFEHNCRYKNKYIENTFDTLTVAQGQSIYL